MTCTGQFAESKISNPVCLRCGRDRFDHIEVEETIALVWDGTLTREPITWAEAEQIARQQIQQRGQLPLEKASA